MYRNIGGNNVGCIYNIYVIIVIEKLDVFRNKRMLVLEGCVRGGI